MHSRRFGPFASKASLATARRGFSLVELLVVIAIVGILTALAAGMLKVRTGNPADATQMVAAACSAAQADAISTGAPAMVVICIDPNDKARYLRYVATLTQDPVKTTATTTYWQPSGKGYYIPQGTLFLDDPAYSNSADTISFDFDNFQQSQTGAAGSLCTFIEFDPTGQVMNPNTNNPQWVFEHGLLNSEGTIVGANKDDLDGFITRRLGKLIFFQSPKQISSPNS